MITEDTVDRIMEDIVRMMTEEMVDMMTEDIVDMMTEEMGMMTGSLMNIRRRKREADSQEAPVTRGTMLANTAETIIEGVSWSSVTW